MKTLAVIVSAFFFIIVLGVNILNAKSKSCSGYLITKSGEIFRSTDMGWSWNRVRNSPFVKPNGEKIIAGSDDFFESNASDNYDVSVFNILGVEVLRLTLPGSMLPIKAETNGEIKNLPKGMYFVRYKHNRSSYCKMLLNY